jgi:2-keto-4-pentenoate hydratase/2-oxohepta-3-ene-1,7-dioic acid hydratase in catechol pathway
MSSRCFGALAVLALILHWGCGAAQTAVSDKPETPFKLATYEGKVGLVLGETLLDVTAANEHLVREAGLPPLEIPKDMRALIEGYDRVKPRLYQMANFFNGKTEGLAFAKAASSAKIEAPIQYPWNLLMAAANYQSHAAEMDTAVKVNVETEMPFLFAKSPRSCIIATGEPYFIPKGRESIDWEGELAVVVGRAAREVPLGNALDYVFGFTVIYDVSDRGGQKRENPIFQGPDWFSGKSRDRAAPMGPFITPIEFLPNHANLRIVTKVNDRVVQDGNTRDLIYGTKHLVHHISNIMTLYPGDVIATGTPDGVGAGRKPPEFLKPGDLVTIEVEGIGTLATPIQAAKPAS